MSAVLATARAATAQHKTRRQRHEDVYSVLKTERDSSWLTHWRDLADYLAPRAFRQHTESEKNRGNKRHGKIINSRGLLALRTATSGMMSGITSPARPWKRLTTPDPDLAEFGPVKDWLHTVDQRMNTVFARTNLYSVLPRIYRHILGFGTGLATLTEDLEHVMRAASYPLGTYVLAANDRGQVDTFMRETTMTVRQVVSKFGDPTAGPGRRWANFSDRVKSEWDAGNYQSLVPVVHVVAPNEEHHPRLMAARFKRYASLYWELNARESRGGEDIFLRQSGFDQFPALAARWDLESTDDVYGSPCPGMEALGDVKGLQLLEKRKAQAIEKAYNPPMTAPTSLRHHKVSSLPGDVTYEDVRQGQQGLRPVYEVKPDIQGLLADIEAHEMRIREAFFEPLFLMLTNDARAQPPTAEEIRAREGERLLMLGPVLERLNDDVLNPAIDLTFEYMMRAGMIPTPPRELENMELKVEFISILHQAQRMVSTASMDRFFGTIRGLAELKPEVLDKADFDQAVDEYGDQLGVPPGLIVPDEDVVGIRRSRARQQAQAQAIATAEHGAKTAKDLAAADTEGKNALTDLAAAMQGGGAV